MRTTAVSIVILNWNGLDDTLNCLKSLSRIKCPALSVQIIVIDNGSDVDPTPEIQATFAETKTLRLPQNIGFAAGCNLGIKEAALNGAKYILLLNNDTIISADLPNALTKCFDAARSIGVVSPIIHETSNPERIDFAGGHINFALGQFEHERQAPKSSQPFETDYVSGCCMMISKTVIDRIGLFDEKLFAYCEDVDLCLRAQRAGLKTMCVPSVSIMHVGSASTRRTLIEGATSPLKHYLIARNRTVIVRRYATAPAKCFYFLLTMPARACFYTIAFILRRRWAKLRWFWRGILDGVTGKLEMPAELRE